MTVTQGQWKPIREKPKEWPDADDFYADRMENLWKQDPEATRKSALEAMWMKPFTPPEATKTEEWNSNATDWGAVQKDSNEKYVPPVDWDNLGSVWAQWIPEAEAGESWIIQPDVSINLNPVEWGAQEWVEEVSNALDQVTFEAPTTPLITRLSNEWYIPKKIVNAVAKSIAESNWEYDKALTEYIEIPKKLRDAIVSRLKDMNNPEKVKEFQEAFKNNYHKELKIFQDDSWDFLVGSRQEEAFEMVGAAYMTWSEQEWWNKEALDMAFKTAFNRAIKWRMNIPTHSEEYKRNRELVLNEDVSNPDISFNVRYSALMKILEITHKGEWIKGRKSTISKQRRDKVAGEQEAKLTKKFDEYQAALQVAQDEWNIKEATRIRKLMERPDKNKENLAKWEIMWGNTQLEIWWTETQETPKKAA